MLRPPSLPHARRDLAERTDYFDEIETGMALRVVPAGHKAWCTPEPWRRRARSRPGLDRAMGLPHRRPR